MHDVVLLHMQQSSDILMPYILMIDVLQLRTTSTVSQKNRYLFKTKYFKMIASSWFRDTCKANVGDVVKDRGAIVSVEANTTLAATLDILNENNITTVAVYGKLGHWLGDASMVFGGKQYIGMTTILDILSFLLKADNIDLKLQCRVADVIGSTVETMSMWIESVDRPLFFCMEQFCRGTHHAFAIDGATRSDPKMLSQSDLVNYLVQNEGAMPHVASVLDIPIGSIASKVRDHVLPNTTMRDAVHHMLQHHAVPVMGSDGSVLSTLSASDLKGQLSTMVALIAPMTVMDFLLYRNGDVIPPPFVLPITASVREAAHGMIRLGMHRVWVAGASSGDAGVVSLTDIIRAVFNAELPHDGA